MKNLFQTITCLVLLIAAAFSNTANAQCAYNNSIYQTWDASTQLVNVTDQVSNACTFGGEYNRVTNMVAGNTYRVSTCTNTAFDTQITIFTVGGGTQVAFDDDNCGLQTEISFTPGTSGDYDIQVNEYDCITNTTCMDLVVELTAIGAGVGCSSTGTNYPTGTFTPNTSWQTASTVIYAGEYSLYNVTSGTVYEWSLCVADGGAASYDSQLTLFNNANLATGLAYSDDVCGDDAKINWTATFSGVARVMVNQFSCATNSIGTTMVYRSVGPTPPVNDECAGALELSPSTVCTPITGTVANATQSMAAITCDTYTGTANDDVWYSFVADNTTATVTVVGSANFDAVVEVLTGTCGATTNYDCADLTVAAGTETVALTGLSIGNAYFIRVYDYLSGVPATPTFDICVVSTPTGPLNDDCAGAIALTVGNAECSPIAGTVASATQSPTTGCGTGTPDDDVWYSFVATGTTAIVDVLGGTGFDGVVDLYAGTNCADIASIGCIDGTLAGELESGELTGLTIGVNYWIRVYDYFSGTPTGTDFTICVFNPCAVTAPGGATAEVETCGADANGGCNMVTPAYQTITCNESVLGTMWADTSIRDTDWFQFTVAANTTATWTASAEIPFAICLIDISNCAAPVVISNGGVITTGLSCTTASASAALTPGTYAAFMAPDDYNYYVCSGGLYNQYWATLTMTTTSPVVTPGGATTFCQGGNVTLTSSLGASYLWAPGGATTASISATAAGNYTVTVPDPNGCGPLTSAPVAVTVNPNPSPLTISANGATTFCAGGSVILTAGSALNWLWSPGGATTQAITVTTSGSYTVTTSNVNSCTSTSTATDVTVNPNPVQPSISANGSTTFCAGGSVILTSSSATSYLWSPGGATTQAITATANGSYTVTIGNVNNCTSTSTATDVTVNLNPTASFTFTQNDPTIDFNGSASGGTPGYTYAWDFGDGGSGTGAITSHTYASANTYTVELCVTDANSCTNCTTQPVTILTIGIDNNSSINELNIFPNPANDVLNIVFNMATTENVEVKLMNSVGQLVFNEKLNQFSGNYNKQLNIASYATGNYMLQVVSDSGIINRKIVVK